MGIQAFLGKMRLPARYWLGATLELTHRAGTPMDTALVTQHVSVAGQRVASHGLGSVGTLTWAQAAPRPWGVAPAVAAGVTSGGAIETPGYVIPFATP